MIKFLNSLIFLLIISVVNCAVNNYVCTTDFCEVCFIYKKCTHFSFNVLPK